MMEPLPQPAPAAEQQLPLPEAEADGKSLFRELIETILLAIVIFLVVNGTTGRFRIEGDSMRPNMHDGQYVIVNRLAYAEVGPAEFGRPQRGDVVVFRYPMDPSRDFIKRVIGLPGERVEITGGAVKICQGQVGGGEACETLVEPYIQETWSLPPGTWTLGPNEYFVMGDNRRNSSDSHNWGPLNGDAIIGKAWVSYWPPSNWGTVPHYTFSGAEASQP